MRKKNNKSLQILKKKWFEKKMKRENPVNYSKLELEKIHRIYIYNELERKTSREIEMER